MLPYCLAQIAGAFAAAALMRWNYWEAFNRFDPLKTFKSQGMFSTSPNGISLLGGLRDQVILTAILVMLIFALIDTINTAPQANMGPLLIGLLVTAIGFAYGVNSAWAINPAAASMTVSMPIRMVRNASAVSTSGSLSNAR